MRWVVLGVYASFVVRGLMRGWYNANAPATLIDVLWWNPLQEVLYLIGGQR